MADSSISGRKVTSEIIESHLKCRRKSGLLLAGERGSKSDYEVLLTDTRECARIAASSKVISDSKEVVPSDVLLTVPVLRRGFAHLLNATLEDENVSIRFDGLRRVAGLPDREDRCADEVRPKGGPSTRVRSLLFDKLGCQ